MEGYRQARPHAPKPGFTSGAAEPPCTPTDELLTGSPRWEAACCSPLLAEVAERGRPPQALVEWVTRHNALAGAYSALALAALRAAPAEHTSYIEGMDSRLRDDARFAAGWARTVSLGGPEAAPPAPATSALLDLVAQVAASGSYHAVAVGLWQWFEV